jgi:HAMP domain-containing protein
MRRTCRRQRSAPLPTPIHFAIERNDLDGATDLLGSTVLPVLDRMDQGILRLSDAIGRETTRRVTEAEGIATATMTATYTALVVAFLVFALLAWLAARILSEPLDRLRHSMGNVAEGQPVAAADPACQRSDEIGELFRSFHAMTDPAGRAGPHEGGVRGDRQPRPENSHQRHLRLRGAHG